MLPVPSEPPQVFTSTVEADKAAASQVTKDEGQVGTRPVLVDLPREATEDSPSLMGGPPHGLHTYGTEENEGN